MTQSVASRTLGPSSGRQGGAGGVWVGHGLNGAKPGAAEQSLERESYVQTRAAVQGGKWWIGFSVGQRRLAMAKRRLACSKHPSAECRPETWESC